MSTFDAPDLEFCLIRLSRTNTPLQAFVMLHDPQFIEAARQLAGRMITSGKSPQNRITHGFRIITARKPSPRETQILSQLYTKRLSYYQANPKAVDALLAIGEVAKQQSSSPAELAAWPTVARAMLNLSEAITKN